MSWRQPRSRARTSRPVGHCEIRPRPASCPWSRSRATGRGREWSASTASRPPRPAARARPDNTEKCRNPSATATSSRSTMPITKKAEAVGHVPERFVLHATHNRVDAPWHAVRAPPRWSTLRAPRCRSARTVADSDASPSAQVRRGRSPIHWLRLYLLALQGHVIVKRRYRFPQARPPG